MVSGEAMVETGLDANQTALRTASDEFCDKLEDNGWVTASTGLAGLASILMNGSKAAAVETGDYLNQFEDETHSPDTLVVQLAQDAEQVRIGLIAVTGEAQTVLANTDTQTQRGDVTSFERALVRAQRARRTFASARDLLAERTDALDPADIAIARLDAEIDAARHAADDLAARYASLGGSAV
ncbi:MAG: hypothetical protein MRY64_03970 [Hyphomonadaceae bacterium]|nr:hypothetical protein [Hyphomonadaceae bacterium]